MESLDHIDLQILRTLQDNARLTTKELAARVHLSTTPVFERLKRLEAQGYIKKYIAVLDAEKAQSRFFSILPGEAAPVEQRNRRRVHGHYPGNTGSDGVL